MQQSIDKIFQGIPLEEEDDLTIIQLCSYCDVSPEHIVELVNEGILDPVGRAKAQWRFTFTTVERVRKVKRLQTDFELTLSGAALAIHLLDRIEELERLLERRQR